MDIKQLLTQLMLPKAAYAVYPDTRAMCGRPRPSEHVLVDEKEESWVPWYAHLLLDGKPLVAVHKADNQQKHISRLFAIGQESSFSTNRDRINRLSLCMR